MADGSSCDDPPVEFVPPEEAIRKILGARGRSISFNIMTECRRAMHCGPGDPFGSRVALKAYVEMPKTVAAAAIKELCIKRHGWAVDGSSGPVLVELNWCAAILFIN